MAKSVWRRQPDRDLDGEHGEQDARDERAEARPVISTRRIVVTIAPRTLWLIAGIVTLFIVTWILLTHALDVLFLVFISVILAEGVRPVVERLRRVGVPRPVSVLLVYLGALVVVAGLAWLLLQPLIQQATEFAGALPQYVQEGQGLLNRLQEQIGSNQQLMQGVQFLEERLGALLGAIVPAVFGVPLTVGNIIFSAIVILVITFFWLTGVDQLKPFTVGLFPTHTQLMAQEILNEIGRKLGGYLRGVLVNMFAIGILSWLGLLILGVPYPGLLGILAGLTEFIPYLGPWISGSVAVLVALLAVDPLKAAEVALLFVIIQQVEGNTLVPLVMNRAVELHPLLIVIAVLLGGALFGLIGSVLAVPLTAVIDVLVRRVLVPMIHRASASVSVVEAGEAVPPEPEPEPESPLAGKEQAPKAQ
ncbi:MAG: hypothetical protein OJF49_001836 [Ktedonobacterales bacterium]|jgi:predicted PurR-regulated permease PerM|nr:MAG: hypothetical protein OJF49_001836 [Ktedonobacterales bacterium]